MKLHEKELQQLAGQTDVIGSYDVPIFVCTLSFPNISCPLHVFEPRYRLMIRRCMEVGTREFGMCCHVGYNTAKVEFLEDERVPEDQVQELIKVHDETLEQTKNWFEGSSDFVKKGIVDHYGNLPETEADFWTMPNGPTWLWWVLNTLPIDPPLKLLLLSKTSLKERLENTRRILRFLAKGGKN